MSATFAQVTDWFGSIQAGYETANKVAGKAAPQDGYLWQRKVYTIDRTRTGQTLTGFTPEVGNEVAGNTLSVTNGADEIFASSSQTYIFLKDDMVPSPVGSAIWDQKQTAVSFSDWEEWEIPS